MRKLILLLLFFYLFGTAGCRFSAVPNATNPLPSASAGSGPASRRNNPYFYTDDFVWKEEAGLIEYSPDTGKQTPAPLHEGTRDILEKPSEPKAPIREEAFGKIENEYLYFTSLHERSGIAVDIPKIELYYADACQSNDLLRQAAFSLWEETYEDAAAYLKEWQASDDYEATEVTYEVLGFSEDYASFVFSIMSFGGSTYYAHHCVSVNLRTGESIRLEDIASPKQVINAVKCGHFSVYIGTYSEFDEADAHTAEIIDLLTAELDASLFQETEQEGYNRYSCQNIGLDGNNLYLYMKLPDIAFHDYMILCIPLEALTEEIPQIYENWGDFPVYFPYAGEKAFALIKAAYDKIDFSGEFETGDTDTYDYYLKKYREMIEHNAPVYNPETGERLPFLETGYYSLGSFLDRYSLEDFDYYFFDIDGDSFPELGIWYYGLIRLMFDYDADSDEYSLWYNFEGDRYRIGGTKKVFWTDGRLNAFYQLDENGKEEYSTFFYIVPYSEAITLYMVMMPEYADESRESGVPAEIMEQGLYERSSRQWYFRLTEEQYKELSAAYKEALHLLSEKEGAVIYTYEELFEF